MKAWDLRTGFRIARWTLEVFLVLFFVQSFVFHLSVVRGTSMQPSIRDGDIIFVDRAAVLLGAQFERGDIIVMRSPDDPDVDYVKRIVGLPGEQIEIRGGRVRVNGRILDESFGVPTRERSRSWNVPEGKFFVLGDNRSRSCDSRDFGVVNGESIKGKVRFCFWPPHHLPEL